MYLGKIRETTNQLSPAWSQVSSERHTILLCISLYLINIQMIKNDESIEILKYFFMPLSKMY